MYLLSEFIFLSPVMVYACFRIRWLIATKILKNASTVLFILLVAGYPIAESLSHNSGNVKAGLPMLAGYYSLPFLLYLLMTVVALDLIVGVASWSGILGRERVGRPGFRMARLHLFWLVPASIVFMGALNNDRLLIKEYTVQVPAKQSRLDRLRIAFAADFHLGILTQPGFVERFVTRVNSINPDIVLLGGDVIEGGRRGDNIDRFEAQFRRIQSRYGVYAVPGNHETMRGGGTSDFFAKSGITLLQDSVVKIDDGFYLAGRKDGSRSPNRKSLEDLLRGTPNDLPLILLDHRPTELDAASRNHVDIQLSGHTHNGQLFPVNYISRMQYELSWGYKKKGGTHFFVTSGVQVWGPPVRTAGDSEILLINVSLVPIL